MCAFAKFSGHLFTHLPSLPSSSLQLKDAKALLEHQKIVLYPQSVTDGCMVGGKPVLRESRPSDNDYQAAILRFTRYSVQALLKGVRRAHLVAPGTA